MAPRKPAKSSSDIIRKRLKTEFDKRFVTIPTSIETVGISKEKVTNVLMGPEPLTFDFVVKSCDFLGLHPMMIMSSSYKDTNILFRKIKTNVASLGELQDIFISIWDLLQQAEPRRIDDRLMPSTDYLDSPILLLPYAIKRVEYANENWGSDVTAILTELNVNVIAVNREDLQFDGMFITTNQSDVSAIFINNSKPISRVKFTLAHELSHFLFDQGQNIEVDQDINYFENSFDSSTMHEYLATKFAQFLLVPFDHVDRMYHSLGGNLNNVEEVTNHIQETVTKYKVSTDVVINAMRDYWLLQSAEQSFPYNNLKDISRSIGSERDVDMQRWIKLKQFEILKFFEERSQDFTEDRLDEIKRSLGY